VAMDSAGLDEAIAAADKAATGGDLAAAVEGYARALELFGGEPLAGLPGPFVAGERLRLGERRMAVTLQRLDWQLRLGRHAEAVAESSALAEAHPHNEALAGLLMRALYASGRQVDALKVYTQTRARLVKDLAIEPGEELRRL